MIKIKPKESKTSFSFCESCFEKQCTIDKLEDENIRLKQRIKTLEKRNKEGYFGSSTPSAQKPFKENTEQTNTKKNGGAKKGHKGHGRKKVSEKEADIVEHLECGNECPACGGKLRVKEEKERSVIDAFPVKAVKKIYKYSKKYCPKCKKIVENKPVILPKSLYGNQLLAQAATMHYFHGVPMGKIEKIIGSPLPEKRLHMMFHRLNNIFKGAIPKIIEEYRQAPVKHADETGWRTDGEGGYAWIFCSMQETIFQFKDTRSARVPKKIFGEDMLPGVLVVDRYGAYNKSPCKIQYCYAHLLRDVKDYGDKYPEKEEVQTFVSTLIPLLSEAMHLRTTDITDKTYFRKAKSIKKKILKVVNSPATDFGIQNIQMTFKEKESRLYHWVEDRNIPAENNKAERELRPTVIARKVSFGSQSKKGALTRSVLMTILHTAQKRLKNQDRLVEWFKGALDKISINPKTDPYFLLPPPNI